ncbi:MAG: response regulator [Desulfobacteraceae bacterium]|jgi:CheY-like chemotaxis protein
MQNGQKPYELKKLLLIESQASIRETLCCALETCGHAVHAAATAEKGLQNVFNDNYDGVICNQHLPGMSGLEFFSQTRTILFGAVTILTAEFGDDCFVNSAYAIGVSVFLEKPYKLENLLTCLHDPYLRTWYASVSHGIDFSNREQMVRILICNSSGSKAKSAIIRPPAQKSISRPGRQWTLYFNENRVGSPPNAATPHLELISCDRKLK